MKRAEEQLSAEQLLQIVLDTIPMRVFWKDLELNYLGANQNLLNDIGFENINQLVGKSDFSIFENAEEAEPKRQDDREVIQSGKAKLNIEEPLVVADQKPKWLRTNKVPMKTADGTIIGVLGTYQDITEEVEYRKRIEQLALIDHLTGLANRRSLQRTILNAAYASAGLMFIDLDRFKRVNDSLGHAAGDHLLRKVARTFQEITDEYDATLARLGGDEFSIFKTFASPLASVETLQKIANKIIESLGSPIRLNDHVVSIGASIGITTLSHPPQTTRKCFTEADLAMYSAKKNSLCNFAFFNEELRTKAERLHTLHSCLSKAIENAELFLVFQPQFNCTDDLIGAEALLRWRSAELGDVTPDEFIPIAEESGIIHEIGRWVISTSLDCLAKWESLLSKIPNFRLSVNVSSSQFRDHGLANFIEEQLNDRHVSGKNFEIEITESLLLNHSDNTAESLIDIKKSGISIAVDDFGTGYSSLAYIATLPLDKLKIDRSFVTNLDTNLTNKKLVETIVNLASSLNLEIIAEGVETRQEKTSLEHLKCSQFQGYWFEKPMSEQQFQQRYISE